MSAAPPNSNNTRLRRKVITERPDSGRKQKNISIKKVSGILKKREEERTSEENEFLFKSAELAKEAASRLEKRELLKQREKEFEDSEDSLDEKCLKLAEALVSAKYLVVYTGAGISTAARIPDYRGTEGIWTKLQQGKDIGEHDLTQAEPTLTHMALAEMFYRGRLKHVVSQNCDGLHLRSGLPRTALSELHGNMYIEVCRTCRREYLRLFDVTESTARFNHRTQRRCYRCNAPLVDSIVHFGERGNLPWPLNWKGACRASEKADVILCMGSSLKVLKRYPWLWCMDKPAKRRPKLFIINLQWTPKDCHAELKIHGKCDTVMSRVMKYLTLQVPDYRREKDPIFIHATPLCPDEQHTTTRHCLEPAPDCKEELILITVESDPPACCEDFTKQESHTETCRNYVEASKDVPIIMAPEIMPTPPYSFMEAMFFNYLYTLISSLTYPNTTLPPMPSTSTDQGEDGIQLVNLSTNPDDGFSLVNKSTILDEDDIPLVKPSPPIKCSFCLKEYGAESCYFYCKYQSEFEPSSQACLCCGDDDESDKEKQEEEFLVKEENIEGCPMVKKEKIEKEECVDEKKEEEKPKTGSNPGWYGKGYRKRVKKKR